MAFASRALLLVCVVSLIASSSAQFHYPCPTQAANGQNSITASDFYHFHNQYPFEWYYATGTLCEVDSLNDLFTGSCDHPIGYQLTEWLTNTTVSGLNIIAAAAQLAVSSPTRYQIGAQGLPVQGLLNSFNLDFLSTNVLATFTLISGTPGTPGANYVFTGTSPNATITLSLRQDSPLLYDGFGGFAPTTQGAGPEGVCTSYYYFSVPRLTTTGTITLNGKTKLVHGTSWFDHQWGANPYAVPAAGWIWIGLHLGSESLLVFIPRMNQQNLLSLSWINIQAANGAQTNATVTSVTVVNTWTSPESGITYPIKLSFQTNVPAIQEILLTPLWQEQESDLLGAFYWEGYVSVSVQAGPNAGSTGNGYLELVGFRP